MTALRIRARDLLTEVFPYTHDQMAVRNDVLKRSYIRNYKHEQPTYLKGSFTVLSARHLAPADVVSKGWIVRARAADLEDVISLALNGDTAPNRRFNYRCIWTK